MNEVNLLIVDDDDDTLFHLGLLLEHIPKLKIYSSKNYFETQEILQTGWRPEVALLDIYLKNSTQDGIAIGALLKKMYEIPIVFMTNHYDAETYQRAKSVNPSSFIGKEFKALELRQAIELALPITKNPQTQGIISFRTGLKIIQIKRTEVLWVEVEGRYSKICLLKKKILVNHPLKEMIDVLGADSFLRIHKSYIIDINAVQEANLSENYILLNNLRLPIGRSFRKSVIEQLTTS